MDIFRKQNRRVITLHLNIKRSSSSKPNRAMKLGSSKDILPAFIEQQMKSVNTPSSAQQAASTSSNVTSSSTGIANQTVERVHIKVEEKLSLTCGKDGGVQNFELLGVLYVRIGDEESGRIRVIVKNSDERNLQMQTNPNIDKNLFKANSIIGLRDATKSFPVGTDIGVLKWRYQCQEEQEIPLTINCWPSETKNGCDVSIEYELQNTELELENVVVVVPVPSNIAAPVIKQIDGDYSYEKFKNCLIWRLGTIDNSNSTGSIDFSCSGHPSDFFPINVNFVSHTSFCNIQVMFYFYLFIYLLN
jgi:coatomer subunit delta